MGKKRVKFDTSNEPESVVYDLGRRKKFHPKDLSNLTPANPRQQQFFDTFYSGTPIVSLSGPAGTGKTFLALYAALSLVFDSSTEYDKVVVIRSAVEARKQGFLPGTIEEKNAPLEAPYEQVISKIMPDFNDGYSHLKSLDYLSFETTGWMRGQTFDRTIILLDEVQNCDYDEISTIITRMGDFSRIVLMGDQKQCDLTRYNQNSGMSRLMKVLEKMPELDHANIQFELEDIVRSGIVRNFLIADYHTS